MVCQAPDFIFFALVGAMAGLSLPNWDIAITTMYDPEEVAACERASAQADAEYEEAWEVFHQLRREAIRRNETSLPPIPRLQIHQAQPKLETMILTSWVGSKTSDFKVLKTKLAPFFTGKTSVSTKHNDTFHEISITLKPDEWVAKLHPQTNGIFVVEINKTDMKPFTVLLWLIKHVHIEKNSTARSNANLFSSMKETLIDKKC